MPNRKDEFKQYVSGEPLLKITFKLDNNLDVYNYQRSTVLGAMGNIGGMQALISIFTFAVVRYFGAINYASELIDELFLKKINKKKTSLFNALV